MRRIMVIDASRCVGCEACVVACKTENAVPEGQYRDWVVQETRGEFPELELFIQSQRCNHCTDAPCVANCPTGASYYRGDGTVQVDRDACTGLPRLHRLLPLRRALRQPGGLRRQVHALRAPPRPRRGHGVPGGLPDLGHRRRRRRRSPPRWCRCASAAAPPRSSAPRLVPAPTSTTSGETDVPAHRDRDHARRAPRRRTSASGTGRSRSTCSSAASWRG